MRVVFGFVLILGIALAGFAVYLANGYVNSYRVALAKAKGAEGIATVEVFVATKRMNYGDKLDKDAVRVVKFPRASVPEGTFLQRGGAVPYHKPWDELDEETQDRLRENPQPGVHPRRDGMKITEIAPGSTTLYGCGVNPAGSMSVAGGSPAIGDTLELGLDNPLGTQAAGSLTVLALAVAPDAAFPCGLGVPGLGMAGAGAVGELLVDFSIPGLLLNGPAWAGPGSPAVFQLPIPCNPLLVGSTVYAQGAIVDPVAAQGVTVGLTDAVEILLGS